MKRDRWANLNGMWEYAIRPRQELLPTAMDGKVLVPFAVESKLSGVLRSVTPADRLWYRRSFTVPSEWKGERVLLHFGAVDYESEVMVNGSLVGAHRGGSDPFTFDVTDYLKPGANDLVVQVLDPTSTGSQPRGKQQLKPEGIWYTPVTGIWQTVWLEPVPALHLEDVNATPDTDGGTLAVTGQGSRVERGGLHADHRRRRRSEWPADLRPRSKQAAARALESNERRADPALTWSALHGYTREADCQQRRRPALPSQQGEQGFLQVRLIVPALDGTGACILLS